jgi:hypothetical protein
MDFNDTRRSTVRPRRSIFLIAATSFALTFTTLGIAPAGANQQGYSSSITSGESEISRLLVSYEPGVSPVNVSGDVTGQNFLPNIELDVVERIGRDLFTVNLPGAVSESEATKIANELEKSPQVAIVEPDYPISLAVNEYTTTTQDISSSDLWGLDRIDQRSSTLNGTYKHDNTGLGVDAYVIDTGIYPNDEFENRLELGYNAVSDLADTLSIRHSTDCSTNGHGTHVAGILGGKTYGVAKKASLIPIRVFDCNGDAYNSDVIYGIDWAIRHHQAGVLAVANMSLGGNKSVLLDYWVQLLIDDGVHVVVASGNKNEDACNSSPASTPGTITVNSSGLNDIRSSFSNFGACTDIFAPGESILSAGNSNPISTRTSSGTSMASPFVAGAVAKILEANPNFTRSQVISELLSNSTPFVSGKLRDPSRLIYSPAVVTKDLELQDVALQQQLATIAATSAQMQVDLEAAEAARIAAAAEAARLAAIPAPAPAPAAPAPAPVAAPPVAVEVIGISNIVKRKFTLTVDSPAGSKTWIQRKSGKKWVTLKKVNSSSRSVVKVSKSGTYRIQIVGPSRKVVSSPFKVK